MIDYVSNVIWNRNRIFPNIQDKGVAFAISVWSNWKAEPFVSDKVRNLEIQMVEVKGRWQLEKVDRLPIETFKAGVRYD